ncbi:MAG: N-6 DNA methylase [Acidimicrobiales bacterium]|nr:N-6 DNA methylase [Acidimicrobiales bacterium]
MTSRAGTPSPTDPARPASIDAWADIGAERDHAAVLAAAVAVVARALDVDVAFEIDGAPVAPDDAILGIEVDPELLSAWGPWLPGQLREALLDRRSRAAGGVHHTAPDVAAAVVDVAAGVRPFGLDDIVLDPAVGGGAFLLAVAERLSGARADVIARLRGLDTDPLAVATSIAALRLWAGGAPVGENALRVGDGLTDVTDERIDWVIGNPPFLAQLKGETVRDRARHASLRRRWPELGAYTDDAAAFLLAGADAVRPDGVVALVQPTSVLSARDAAAVRSRLTTDAPLQAIWLDDGRRFDAAVDTVALVLQRGADTAPVARFVGVPPVARADGPPGERWAALLIDDPAAWLGDDEFSAGAVVGDVASVTAGFRDQFYGLRGAVHEDPDAECRLITSGLIDPLEDRWGTTPCRFDGRRWEHPGVRVADVDPSIAAWVAARLRPKLLVANQTRTIEVLIDDTGGTVPCTPVVSVEPGEDGPSLAHLAAALCSPVATALLLREAAGSALSSDAMRISAAAIAALPLPVEGAAWDAAAALVTRRRRDPTAVSVEAIGEAAMAAYGVEGRSDLHKWWHSRLPRR